MVSRSVQTGNIALGDHLDHQIFEFAQNNCCEITYFFVCLDFVNHSVEGFGKKLRGLTIVIPYQTAALI